MTLVVFPGQSERVLGEFFVAQGRLVRLHRADFIHHSLVLEFMVKMPAGVKREGFSFVIIRPHRAFVSGRHVQRFGPIVHRSQVGRVVTLTDALCVEPVTVSATPSTIFAEKRTRRFSVDVDVVHVVVKRPVCQVGIPAVQRPRVTLASAAVPKTQSIAFSHPSARHLV